MPYHDVKLFERDEREGWRLIMPLEGRRKQDSNLLNPEAAGIFDALRRGRTPTEICDRIWQEHRDVPYERIRNDVYGSMVQLRELGVYEMTESEMQEMCSSPTNRLPGLHVMDETEIRPLSERLRTAYEQNRGMFLFEMTSFQGGNLFDPFQMRTWHFNALYTFFVHNDPNGNLDGALSVVGLGTLSPVLPLAMLVVFQEDPGRRSQVALDMLRQLEMLLKSLTQASKLRFILYEGDGWKAKSAPSSTAGPSCQNASCETGQVTARDELFPVMEDCGYRHEVTLPHEGGPGVHVTYYTKALV
jgi:hypothetical protein